MEEKNLIVKLALPFFWMGTIKLSLLPLVLSCLDKYFQYSKFLHYILVFFAIKIPLSRVLSASFAIKSLYPTSCFLTHEKLLNFIGLSYILHIT